MKRKLPFAVIPLLLLLAAVLAFQHDAPVNVAGEDQHNGAAKSPGMMLYVDPDTGEFVEASSGSYPVEVAYDDALSNDDWGLAEEAAPKGGGTMMNLQGRFMSTYTATVDESGVMKAECDLHPHIDATDSQKEGE